jgi:hypothetical protein
VSEARTLKDLRAVSMRDVPYSAYCQVCWHNVYCLWVAEEPHNGECINGHIEARQCIEARNRDFNSLQMRRARNGEPPMRLEDWGLA